MTDKLIMQSHGSGDDMYRKWLALSEPIHRRYAGLCGADYQLFVGEKRRGLHPAWNRIPMFLDAFAAGYRKVVWLDADSLVVDLNADIFEETSDIPLQMTRVKDWFWREEGWEGYNDGVCVATQEARAAFEFVWSKWDQPFLEHHISHLWELNWLLDWCFEHPERVGTLSPRFNWQPFAENLHLANQAVICSWHGVSHTNDERFLLFEQRFLDRYGVAA